MIVFEIIFAPFISIVIGDVLIVAIMGFSGICFYVVVTVACFILSATGDKSQDFKHILWLFAFSQSSVERKCGLLQPQPKPN